MTAPVDLMLDAVDWQPLPEFDGVGLHATHEGHINFGELRLKCYVLSDGQRVFDADSMEEFFGARPRPNLPLPL